MCGRARRPRRTADGGSPGRLGNADVTSSRLPLPVASLVRRARRATSPKERHDTAYFAWEASVRLAAAVSDGVESIGGVPSVGDWVRAVSFPDTSLDAPEVLAVSTLWSEVARGRKSQPQRVALRQLLQLLPAYRNQVLGHGSVRASSFYDYAAAILLAGLEAA